MSRTTVLLPILDALLATCAILAAPLLYFGSLVLLGLGHGSTLFYQMYDTPPWIGFILPTVAGVCASLGSHRALRWVALSVAIISIGCQAWAAFTTDWDV